MKLLPLQVDSINRKDIIQPYSCIDLIKGNRRDHINLYLDLLHGANYNDPQPFSVMSYAQAKYTA